MSKTPSLLIETIAASLGSEVSFCPERGGIITSLKLHGTEILYFDRQSFEDRTASVRGGIPILFPNAGAFKSQKFPGLEQHGFARNSSAWNMERTSNGFVEVLLANDDTREIYPYNFKLSVEALFEEDGSCTFVQKVDNLERQKTLPLSMGLHPYFKVPHEQKKDIVFDFAGGELIQPQLHLWSAGTFISIDNPKVKDPSAKMEIILPQLGTLLIDASAEYQKIWIWSERGKDFICIEPVMRNPGGLVDDPEEIGPQETFSASVTFSLKKEV